MFNFNFVFMHELKFCLSLRIEHSILGRGALLTKTVGLPMLASLLASMSKFSSSFLVRMKLLAFLSNFTKTELSS